MKRVRFWWLPFVWLVITFARPALATDANAAAKDRAALYQAEAIKELSDYHWAVARTKPGMFTAVHEAYPGGARFSGVAATYRSSSGEAAMPVTVFYLTVKFRHLTANRTEVTAGLVGYIRNIFGDKIKGNPKFLGPSPANNPEMTQYIRDKLASAEKRMEKKHPEYRAN